MRQKKYYLYKVINDDGETIGTYSNIYGANAIVRQTAENTRIERIEVTEQQHRQIAASGR